MKKLIHFWKLDLFLALLHKKITTVIVLLSFIAISIGFFGTNHLINSLIDNQALSRAELSSKILRESWFTYSQNVVNRLKDQNIKVTPQYHNIPNAIPNPATYLIELGETLSSQITGTELQLYSEYPFPYRKDNGGPQDSFEEEALQHLKINPAQPFFRRDKVKDFVLFRYAEGVTMQSSCVDCHNSYPTSPKKDWKVGDLRGVIEVNQSINDVMIFAEDGMKVIQLNIAIIVFLLFISIISVITYLRNYNDILHQEVRKKTESLRQLAVIDGLTQLANRRQFDHTLELEWYRLQKIGENLSLLICDIDFFKQYNDTYGHQAGDDCLKLVAQIIADGAKRNGDLAARYGGEEFTLILPGTDAADAAIVAARIIRNVRRLQIVHEKSDIDSYVTLSVGVASLIPNKTCQPQKLIKIADDALYEAKKQGRSRFVIG
ncbi:diguanylate cyclase (GGDEF) domain-containing protein [Xenococcus sp. PCC 7305]|uniref:diguanylate cyclase domain-containing protein n=1 Tax=Xenococcus sp. PCC 7305 TaxID=102125 RepID=UPI0002ABEA00|nr:diguanylate cyclase [Xenococcus sp. PCC 7305]ELS01891.1 diguanylate cyclase (GGDEF) domain-containing protein [Xenococcus sp. PCC 7305]